MHFPEHYLKSNLILTFIDKENQAINEQRFYAESIRDESHINFKDLLERQWSFDDQQSKHFTTFTKTFENIRPESMLEFCQHPASEVNSEHSLHIGKKKLVFKMQQNPQKMSKMRPVSTIWSSPEKVEDMNLFLSSTSFIYTIRLTVLLNIIGMALTDYSFRLERASGGVIKGEYSIYNIVSLHMQLLANSVFSLEIILKLLATSFFADWWNIMNLLSTIACWATIFLDFQLLDGEGFFEFVLIFRMIRCLRAIEVFEDLRKPFEVFLTTIPALSKIFFPLIIFLVFYATIGMILFGGATEHRCRHTPQPLPNATVWPEVSAQICGASTWTCPVGYCGNPLDYGLPFNEAEDIEKNNEFGLVSFDNFLRATLTVFHYAFLSNWTYIKYKFSRFINPYITSMYFVSLATFLFFIIANLIMISLCKSYIEKEKLYEKLGGKSDSKNDERGHQSERKHQIPIEEVTGKLKVIKLIDGCLVAIQCIILAIEFEGMSLGLQQILGILDFALTWVSLLVITLVLAIMRKNVLKDNFNVLDWIVILISIADVFYAWSEGESVVSPRGDIHRVLRTIKFIRLVKLIFVSRSLLVYQRKIINLFFQTLKTLKNFLLFLFCIMLTFSLIGGNLFAYRVRFDINNQVDIVNGKPYVVNFESVYKSIIHIVILFENERWTQTMYNYYYATGFKAIIFFILTVFIVHLMLTRLFIAIFLCYFRRNLEKRSDQSSESEDGDSEGVYVARTKKRIDIKCLSQEGRSSLSSPKILSVNQQEPEHIMAEGAKHKKLNQYPNPTLFWIFDRNGTVFHLARVLCRSRCFRYVVGFSVLFYSISLIVRTTQDSPDKEQVIDALDKLPIAICFLEMFLGVLGNGLYFQNGSYLKQSFFNGLNLFVCLCLLLAEIPILDPLYRNNFRRLMALKICIIFTNTSKEMSIILESLRTISKKFIRVYTIFMFVLLITAIIPLKLQKNNFYTCSNYYNFAGTVPSSVQECINAGGDWAKEIQSFSNILTSLLLMYQIVTSESWTYFIQKSNADQPWDLYFVGVFFFFNICTLNVFVGLIVETYLQLKDKAFKLNLLKPNQRGWMLIKNCINELVPQPSVSEPPEDEQVKLIAFKIVTYEPYINIIDVLAYVNALIFMFKSYRSTPEYARIVNFLDYVFLVIFVFDTILKIYALRSTYLYLQNSKIQLIGLAFYAVFLVLYLFVPMSEEPLRILIFLSAVFQLLRCKKLLFRFTWSKTLVNSVLQILPKCLNIAKLLFAVMFIYVAIGMQLFKYVKPTSKSDGYTTGFANFFTGFITMTKILSNQSWFDQVSAFVRGNNPYDYCLNLYNFSDAEANKGLGCGINLGYVFFISYHVLVSLLILNLLIATMVSAYDENYEKEYNSVNIFQLQDCLQLWQKYDPKGSGVIPYKKFWRLSSEIAILFGISKKKLIKGKQKFLEELNISICQSMDSEDTSVLCYKFHDVITQFSKIKLQVSQNKNDENSNSIQFDIDPMIEEEIRDYKTEVPEFLYKKYRGYLNYSSGDMKYFFGLLRKLRAWRVAAKYKESNTISKLSQIIKIAMEKRQKEEVVMNLINRNRRTFNSGNNVASIPNMSLQAKNLE